MKNVLKKLNININTRPADIFLMLIGVIVMGICVAILKLTHFGPDPFSASCYGISGFTGFSFGTTEVILNSIVFVLVLFSDRSLIGLGTLGNMIVVGYSADFTEFVIGRLFPGFLTDGVTDSFIRIVIMLVSLILFVFACALYMNSNTGTGPYDSGSKLLYRTLCRIENKKKRKMLPFRFIRMMYDCFFTVFAWLIDGEVGVVTVLMVFTLGPAADFVGKLLKRKSN